MVDRRLTVMKSEYFRRAKPKHLKLLVADGYISNSDLTRRVSGQEDERQTTEREAGPCSVADGRLTH